MSDPLLSEPGIEVSSTVVRIGEQVFAVRNITSVRVAQGSKSGCLPGIAVMWGVLALSAIALAADQWICIAAPATFAVATILGGRMLPPPKGKLFVVTAGGEVNALEADNATVIRVGDAIVRAIAR